MAAVVTQPVAVAPRPQEEQQQPRLGPRHEREAAARPNISTEEEEDEEAAVEERKV